MAAKIYQVGGCVRDMLRGQPPHDRDFVVVGATPQEMSDAGFIPVGKSFPVFIHPKTGEEYALARKEIKTGPRHQDFRFLFSPDISLETDLERRDFTCNAIAFDTENQTFIDPFGGMEDIKNKTLRHVNEQHFPEDPLRILRLCRFVAQLDFRVAPKTMNLVSEMTKADMLSHLPAERIWQELEKALQSPNFDKFLLTARQCGALNAILPEVEKLWITSERTDFHPEGNSGTHTILTLKQAAESNSFVRFGLMLHDIGKILTPKEILPSHYNHEQNGIDLIQNICRRLKVPKSYRDFALLACKNHMKFCRIFEMRNKTLVDFGEDVSRLGTDNLENFIAVCRADTFGNARSHASSEYSEFEKKADFLRKICAFLKTIKATDMPNFEKLPKDEKFKNLFREYKIRQLSNIIGSLRPHP